MQIDFEDFKAYASRKEGTIAKSFAQLDVDHNGSISVNDLVGSSTPIGEITMLRSNAYGIHLLS